MSGKAVGWVLDWAEKTNPLALLLLVAVADAAGNDGTGCCESSATLASRIGVSDRQVRRLQTVLVERGDVAITTSRGRHPNRYAITLQNSRGESLADDDRRAKEHYTTRTHRPSSTRTEPGQNPDRTRTEPGKVEHKVNDDPDPDPDPVHTGASLPTAPAPARVREERTAPASPFETFWVRFITLSNGRPGDISEAGAEFRRRIEDQPDAADRLRVLMAHLEHYAASDEVRDGFVMTAAKFLRQYEQWPEPRHRPTRSNGGTAKPDPNAGLREYQAAREAGLSPWDIIAGKRAPEGVIEGELVAR